MTAFSKLGLLRDAPAPRTWLEKAHPVTPRIAKKVRVVLESECLKVIA